MFCFCFNGGKKSEIGPTRADPDVHFDPLDLQAQLFFLESQVSVKHG